MCPDSAPDGRRPPTEADRVVALARTLVDARGLVPVGALVAAMMARGQSLRAAHASLDMLAGSRFVVLTDAPEGRPHRDLEPVVSGAPWALTRITAPKRPQ